MKKLYWIVLVLGLTACISIVRTEPAHGCPIYENIYVVYEKDHHYAVFNVEKDTVTLGVELEVNRYPTREMALDEAEALNMGHERLYPKPPHAQIDIPASFHDKACNGQSDCVE